MLNGKDPVIIIQFKNKLPSVSAALAKIPMLAEKTSFVEQPPIPIYLSQAVTGLYIDSSAKNVDAETSTETKTDGTPPDIKQKGINNSVTVNLLASQDSTGVTLLTALLDVIYKKLTSQEYQITYLNGPITVFGGLLNGFSVDESSDEDVFRISISLSKGAENTPTKEESIPDVEKLDGAQMLEKGAAA